MITQEEKVDQVRSVTLDCQWGTGERLQKFCFFKIFFRRRAPVIKKGNFRFPFINSI
ncbi:hypothetical protein [Vibrio anguillarum]|uniref:hypothetical protein n=1 Tax=Vibrio anguillarum TaxID=55601 RepID=UPI0012FE18F4|nr:hypothetical protein [Vibrio anguillarum]